MKSQRANSRTLNITKQIYNVMMVRNSKQPTSMTVAYICKQLWMCQLQTMRILLCQYWHHFVYSATDYDCMSVCTTFMIRRKTSTSIFTASAQNVSYAASVEHYLLHHNMRISINNTLITLSWIISPPGLRPCQATLLIHYGFSEQFPMHIQ